MKAIFKREFKSFFHNMTGPIFMAAIFRIYGYLFCRVQRDSGLSLSHGGAVGHVVYSPANRTDSDDAQFCRGEENEDGSAFADVSGVGDTDRPGQICRDGVRSRNLYADILHSACRDSFYGGGSLIADYSAIVGFFLLGAAYIAIGMFVSSLTESQIISAVGTFCILLILQLTDGIVSILPSGAAGSYVCFFLPILAAAALLYAMTKNITIAGGFGVICEIILTISVLCEEKCVRRSIRRFYHIVVSDRPI